MSFVFLLIKSVVDLFASGRSLAKVAVLVCFSVGTYALCRFRSGSTAHKKTWTTVALSILVILYTFGMLVHTSTLTRTGNNLGETVLYLSEQEVSSSELTHQHEMKSTFGTFYSTRADSIDLGAAGLQFIPVFVPWIGLILLIAFIVSYSISILRHEIHDKRKIFFVSLLFFILFKNAYDGGGLNYEVAAVGLFALTWLLGRTKRSGHMLPVLIILVFFGMMYFYVFRMLLTFIFLICAYLIVFRKDWRVRSASAFVILFLAIMNAMPEIKYLNLVVSKTEPAYVATFKKDIDKEVLYSVGELSVYRIEEGTVKDLVKEYDLVANHDPVSVAWLTCIPNMYDTRTFRLYTQQADVSPLVEKGSWYHLSLENIAENSYQGTLRTYSCASQVFENQLQEGLRELNALPAIISDFSSQ